VPAPWVNACLGVVPNEPVQPLLFSSTSIAHVGRMMKVFCFQWSRCLTRETKAVMAHPSAFLHAPQPSSTGMDSSFSWVKLDTTSDRKNEKRSMCLFWSQKALESSISQATNWQHIYGWSEMWGDLPRKACTSAQDSWQVLMFEGQTCSPSRAFTILATEPIENKR